MHLIIATIVEVVGKLGYLGIVAAMFLESSFFPFPSEVVIPPAGYLASQGRMSLWLVIILGTLGSLLGALFNYWISLKLGRPLILRYGRFFGLTPRTYNKAEKYFRKHGEISTFVGRLVPGLRQYISLPAGLARMHLLRFAIFTGLGAGIWVTVLALLGYFIGNNQELLKKSLHWVTIYTAIFLIFIVLLYVWWSRRRSHRRALPAGDDPDSPTPHHPL
jgi:membrane protein DedA with SNARE-associated domain